MAYNNTNSLRTIDLKNILNKDVEDIYKNCEYTNNSVGGYFPVGDIGKWHSGCHVTQDCVYPLLSGKLVAYRNYKLKDNEIDKGGNFFLIEHEIENTNIKFCTLYHHIASDEKILKELASDGNFVNVFTKLKLPFYKKWTYEVSEIKTESEMLQYAEENVFPGSCIVSMESGLTVDKLNERIQKNPNDWKLNNLKLLSNEKTTLQNLSFQEVDIDKYLIDVKAFFFKKSDLIYQSLSKEEQFGFLDSNNDNNEYFKCDKSIFLNQKFVKSDLSKDSIKKYQSQKVIIPCNKVGTIVMKDNEPTDILYSVRYDNKGEKIYRIKNDSQLDIKTCPLMYEDVTDIIKQSLSKNILILKESDLDLMLKKEYLNIKTSFTKHLIKDEVYYLLITKKNEDKKLLFFYEGYPWFEEYVDTEKCFDKEIFETYLEKNENSNLFKNLIIFEIKDTNVYKFDSYQELEAKNKSDYKKYSKIIQNGYKFCTKYIQTSQEREYEFEPDKAKVVQIQCKIKNNLTKINGKELTKVGKGIVLYNNFDNNNFDDSNPIKVLTKGFKFETDLIPKEAKTYTFNKMLIKNEVFSAKISKEDLIVTYKQLDKIGNSNSKIKESGEITVLEKDNDKIDITPSMLLGYSFKEYGKYFFDLSLILKKNFMNEKLNLNYNKIKYYIYKRLPESVELFYNNNISKKIAFPKDTKVLNWVKDKKHNVEYDRIEIEEIPLYFSNTNYTVQKRYCKFGSKPKVIYLNLKPFNEVGKSQRLVTIFYTKCFNLQDEFEYEENTPPDKYVDILMKGCKQEFWVTKDTKKDDFLNLSEYTFTNDCPKFRVYSNDPLTSTKAFEDEFYVPAKTKIKILQINSFSQQNLYKIIFIQVPISVHKAYLTNQKIQLYFKNDVLGNSSINCYMLDNSSKLVNVKDVNNSLFNNLSKLNSQYKIYKLYSENANYLGLYVPAKDIGYTSRMWSKEKFDIDDTSKKLNKYTVVNIYERDPAYAYPIVIDKSKIKDSLEKNTIQKINDEIIMNTTTASGCYVPVSIHCDELKYELLLIKKNDIANCRDDAQDWKKFFTICKEKEQIQVSVNDFINLPDFSSKEKNEIKEIIKDAGDQKVTRLFTELNDNRDEIMSKIHKLNVTHMHELDCKTYEKEKANSKKVLKSLMKGIELVPENSTKSCFSSAGCDFNKNLLTFVNPFYFYNHLMKAGMLEFNPYERDGITPPFEMKNNPGFMPSGINNDSFTQLFYEWTGSYYHEGVDIKIPWEACRNATAGIESGIMGTVVAEGNKGDSSYGNFIIIQAQQQYNNLFKYYLLAHLSEKKEHLHVTDPVIPGCIVAYAGNTGNCRTGSGKDNHKVNAAERQNGQGAHLHLQMYLSKDEPVDFIKNKGFKNHEYDESSIPIVNKEIVNPFNYEDSYDNRS